MARSRAVWRVGRTTRRVSSAAITVVAISVVVTTATMAASSAATAAKKPLLAKSPVSGSVLMAQAIRSGAVTLPRSGSLPRGSFLAPGATVLSNVKASAGTSPVNEVPIAANPANGLQLESGANDYNCASLQGFYNSDDGGVTWRQHCMPVSGAGGCGDPNVAYDANGNAYILGIGNCNGSTGSIVFQMSTDNGVTWGPVKNAFGTLLGGLTDKEWTEIDTNSASAFKNCIYTSWTDFDAGFTKTRASVAHSCDGGTTWTRVPVDATQTVPKIDQFTDLAIGPDGIVYLTWMQCQTAGGAGDCGGTSVNMKFSKSADGGNTWSTPITFATAQMTPDNCGCYYGGFPGSSERLADIPVIDISKVDGSLHVGLYTYTGGNSRAEETHSTDGGTTWSPPAQVFASPGNQGFIWLAVSSSGVIGETFFHSAVAGFYVEVAAISTTGGSTFTKKLKLSSATAKFTNDGFGGGFIGDYTGGIWTGTTLHNSWSDARTSPSVDMTGGFHK